MELIPRFPKDIRNTIWEFLAFDPYAKYNGTLRRLQFICPDLVPTIFEIIKHLKSIKDFNKRMNRCITYFNDFDNNTRQTFPWYRTDLFTHTTQHISNGTNYFRKSCGLLFNCGPIYEHVNFLEDYLRSMKWSEKICNSK